MCTTPQQGINQDQDVIYGCDQMLLGPEIFICSKQQQNSCHLSGENLWRCVENANTSKCKLCREKQQNWMQRTKITSVCVRVLVVWTHSFTKDPNFELGDPTGNDTNLGSLFLSSILSLSLLYYSSLCLFYSYSLFFSTFHVHLCSTLFFYISFKSLLLSSSLEMALCAPRWSFRPCLTSSPARCPDVTRVPWTKNGTPCVAPWEPFLDGTWWNSDPSPQFLQTFMELSLKHVDSPIVCTGALKMLLLCKSWSCNLW